MKAKPKDIYSIYPLKYGNVQIRKNAKTEINIVAVCVMQGNGQYTTEQTRKEAVRLANKIVKALND